MRITIIQDTIHWANKQANLQKVELQLAELADSTDLVILSEMFTTGFCTDQLELAETMTGDTIRQLQFWATKFCFAIAGSFIATENDKVFNRAFFVQPNGNVETADKRHLFSMGGEHRFFSGGDKRLIVNYCGFNICLLVCYDIRFPVWARNVSNEYDLLVYVANFPERRISDWDILLKARAVENQCYVCGVNRIGTDGLNIQYNGHSALLDFKANSLLSFPENTASVQTYELNKGVLEQYRDKFAVWKDADCFHID